MTTGMPQNEGVEQNDSTDAKAIPSEREAHHTDSNSDLWQEYFPDGGLWVFGYGQVDFSLSFTFNGSEERGLRGLDIESALGSLTFELIWLTVCRSLIWKPPPHVGMC
jgi:hypothetical protein